MPSRPSKRPPDRHPVECEYEGQVYRGTCELDGKDVLAAITVLHQLVRNEKSSGW